MPPGVKKRSLRRPPRLGRLFDTVRPFYFITFNTHRRQDFLAQPEVHEAFRLFSSKAQDRDVAVGRYVIMPDHIHLFAAFPIAGVPQPNWSNRSAPCSAKHCSGLEFGSHIGRKVFSITFCAAVRATRRMGLREYESRSRGFVRDA